MISLRIHNILDYVIGAVLILCPPVFGFSDVMAARDVFLVLGFGLIGYSLLTQYRYSIAKLIPLGVHMFLDVASGFILMIGPWLFGYRESITNAQTILHFVLGLGAWALVAFTDRRSNLQMIEAGRDRSDEISTRRAA